MARFFAAASSQRYIEAAAPITAEPLTISVRVRRDSTAVGTGRAIVSLGAGSATSRWHVGIDSLSRPVALAANSANTLGTATVGTSTANVWEHYCAVYVHSSLRRLYLNGVVGSDNTTPITVSGVDSLRIGTRVLSGAEGLYWPGDADHVALWDVDLTGHEAYLLHRGIWPERIRPRNLRRFYVLDNRGRFIVDRVTGAMLVPSTSEPTPSVLPFNIRPPGRQIIVPALSEAASTHDVAVALSAAIAATTSATGGLAVAVTLTQAVSIATVAVRSTLAEVSLSTAAQIAATTGSLVQAVASLSVTGALTAARTASIESALGLAANAAVATSVLASMFGAAALQSAVQLAPAGSMAASANLALQAIAAVSTLAGSSVSGSVSLDVHPVVLPDGSLGVVAAIPGLIRIAATDSGLRVTAGSDSIKVH